MGRGATVAAGNPWYEARMRAAKHNQKLVSREGAAEALNMSVSAVQDAELDITKRTPADKAVLMSNIYCAPELLNYYCLHECPIGRNRSISDDYVEIDRATIQLMRLLRIETVQKVASQLQDIAADGWISDDEIEIFDGVLVILKEVSRVISKIEMIRERLRMR